MRVACGLLVFAGTVGLGSACEEPSDDEELLEQTEALTSSAIQHVFVIAMENHDAAQIYGNSSSAPYINNTLIPSYARATNFNDELALSIQSEPHYLWMEAGTNAFADHTFNNDADPSASNSTNSTNHLVTQIKNAGSGISWRSYQEGLSSATGSCPIHSSGFYGAKHNPFVFFQDVAGSPPSASNAYCIAHHRAYSALAADLSASDVASFTFITPNLCNDMHGASGCPDSNSIRSGDSWLSRELPRLIAYANSHAGVIFITWDEGSGTLKMPFLAIGPSVKKGYASSVSFTHSSVLWSIESILQLPRLPKLVGVNSLRDLFLEGSYP